MSLSGSQVALVVGSANAGLVSSVKPSAKSNSITRKGLGGYSKSKLLNHEYEFGWEGDVTNADVLSLALPSGGVPPSTDITIHDLKYTAAYITKMTIKGDQDSPLSYSATAVATKASSGAAVSPSDPGMFFVFSEAVISFGNTSETIVGFSLDIATKAKAIYGTSIDPVSFQFSPTEYSGSFTMAPASSLADVLKGAGDGTDVTFSIVYTNGTNVVNLAGVGVITTDAAAEIKADGDITIAQNIQFNSMTISNT